MENLQQKYQKLASEYSKIRAQANVLKRAVIEEQNKNSNIRETLRNKETALRRLEQEIDSLKFRNKQLEHRVETLQDDLNAEGASKKGGKTFSRHNTGSDVVGSSAVGGVLQNGDPVLSEEFQKKILENAQLASANADKDAEIILYQNRVTDLERQLANRISESTDVEKKFRKEIETLSCKNSELETKVAEAASMLGSEDGLSVHSCDHPSIQTITSSIDEKVGGLEKEVSYWKSQYEVLKLNDPAVKTDGDHNTNDDHDNGLDIPEIVYSKERLLDQHYNTKFEKIFTEKYYTESKLRDCMSECELLQHNLDALSSEQEKLEAELKESQRLHQIAEEDLATTRINYEEQISVLTEQVISLSDMLANSK